MTHKKQGLALTLTKDALEALFPIGTQAYVDLRQAVLQNFVDSHIKPRIDSGVDQYGQQILANVKQNLLKNLQAMTLDLRNNSSNAIEFKQTVKSIVAREVDTLVPAMVHDAITNRFNFLQAEIDASVEAYTRKVKENVTKQLSLAISNNVIDILRKTLDVEQEIINENNNQN